MIDARALHQREDAVWGEQASSYTRSVLLGGGGGGGLDVAPVVCWDVNMAVFGPSGWGRLMLGVCLRILAGGRGGGAEVKNKSFVLIQPGLYRMPVARELPPRESLSADYT